MMPTAFEFSLVRDLSARISGAKTLVEEAEEILPVFYASVGQHLKAWVRGGPGNLNNWDKWISCSVGA